MKNLELLFLSNNNGFKPKVTLSKKKYRYNSTVKIIGFHEIKNILIFLDYIKKRHQLAWQPIIIDLRSGVFSYKLVYVILECIIDYLIVEEKCRIYLLIKEEYNILNEGLKNSCLCYIANGKYRVEDFCNTFYSDIFFFHYRSIIYQDTARADIASIKVQDVDNYLKHCGIKNEYCRDIISNVVGELMDNALEHSDSDCLVDIDITDEYSKKNEDGTFYAVNIVVLNYSKVLIGDKLSSKLSELRVEDVEDSERYKNVIEARKYHSAYWNDSYTENDFYKLASFQHKISGRKEILATGGTGLTQLINALEEKADEYSCFVMSGNKIINFHKNCIVNNNGWVGFNESNNFLGDIPDKETLETSSLYFPGTAYNLTFILKQEEI